MKIKSARYFRERYMIDERHERPDSGYDVNYVGCTHELPDGTYTKGFFDLYHGDKNNIGGFLSSFLKIAEDGQAIYEFLQNAADCGSTLFYMFYNEKFFLAVNNGREFSRKGLLSLLNVAQSTKSDSTQIGRFGIGFKLVHRLVGKGDGEEELTHDYKGPILFSWSKKQDLQDLMNGENIEPVKDIDDNNGLPYFLKLILTNFPAEPQEVAKDLEYHDRVLFTQEEYEELASFTKEHLLPYMETDDFNQGSLFFIRLGEGKNVLLDNDYEQNLKVGVEYSLNTLKGLKNVRINNDPISEVKLKMEDGTILKGTEKFEQISPEYKDADIHFSIGYNLIDFDAEKPFDKVEALKNSPTFYKYFPLGDERHKSALFVHCDSFSNEANRRKLHDDNINKHLFPELAKFIGQRLEAYKKENDKDAFNQLYANILLSETPHNSDYWLKAVYYDILDNILKADIPTTDGFCTDSSKVKIRKMSCNIPLSLVDKDYQWFKWYDKKHKELISAAKDKIGLSDYDIVSFIKEVNIEILNQWIKEADKDSYLAFLNEIEKTPKKIEGDIGFLEKLRTIKLLKGNNGRYYSYGYMIDKYSTSSYYHFRDLAFKTSKTLNIEDVLSKIRFTITDINMDDYPRLKTCFPLPADTHLFLIMKNQIAAELQNVDLDIESKKKLIFNFGNFNEVDSNDISSLQLCHDNQGNLKPLSDLIGRAYDVPEWLSAYQIRKEDYFEELDKYLMSENDIYMKIIFTKWDEITASLDLKSVNILKFYQKVQYLYGLKREKNKSFQTKKFIFSEDGQFVYPGSLLFDNKMLDESIDYKSINNVVKNVFTKRLPYKPIARIVTTEPFWMVYYNMCDYAPLHNGVCEEDIKNVLKLCELKHEAFFKAFVLSKEGDAYFINKSRQNYYVQVYTKDNAALKYIEDNYANCMIALPKAFESYNNSEGIISGEAFYNLLMSKEHNVDYNKEKLVDIVKYGSRNTFISRLGSIEFNLDVPSNREDYDYKFLEMACSVLSSKERTELRKKVFIIKDGNAYNYEQIPATADSFLVEGAKEKFDLAQILPEENGNGDLLIELIDKYAKIGIEKEKLIQLFGVSDTVDKEHVYQTLIRNYSEVKNAQQLAFILLMGRNGNNTFPDLKVYDCNNVSQPLTSKFIVEKYSFIDVRYCLSPKYADLSKYINLPWYDNLFVQKPYIDDNHQFVCPGLETKEDTKRIDLLSYLFTLFNKDQSRFKAVNWSAIKDALGFDPSSSVYPGKYAIKEETLPQNIEAWINENKSREEFISAMGCMTEGHVVVRFRRYMTGEPVAFETEEVYVCKTTPAPFERSLMWLANKNIYPLTENLYKNIFKLVIEWINKLRGNNAGIDIQDKIDFDKLSSNAEEYHDKNYSEWKNETGLSIYLYKGRMPHKVSIDEYIGDVIYRYNGKNIASNGKDIIYVNSEADLQTEMLNLAERNNIGLTKEKAYKLFSKSISELEKRLTELESQNKALQSQLQTTQEEAEMSGSNRNDVDQEDRKEYNEEARRIVKTKLEKEGFSFEQGIGDGTSIYGVRDPEGKPVTLVVKSCKGGRLYINPSEWGEILHPNAMLWAYDGGDPYPVKLRELIRNQDKLVLTMDTSNLDDINRVSRFAEVLRYFKQINFELDSYRPTTIASTYKDYAFDDRPKDEELTPDDDF